MAKGDDILERLIEYSVAIVRLGNDMPVDRSSTHIANQLLRCGTAPPANYAEARSGESPRDFVHKLGIALKELNESLVWLKMIHRLELVSRSSVEPLIQECSELCRILAASIRTTRRRQEKQSYGDRPKVNERGE